MRTLQDCTRKYQTRSHLLHPTYDILASVKKFLHPENTLCRSHLHVCCKEATKSVINVVYNSGYSNQDKCALFSNICIVPFGA